MLYLNRRVEEFTRRYFGAKRGALVSTSVPDADRISARITSLRGEVVQGQRFWEEVELRFTVTPKAGNFRLVLIADGRYGAGLLNPPAPGGYTDLEPQFSVELQGYCDRLLVRLQAFLEHDRI